MTDTGDVDLAARLAYEAGQRLLALRDGGGDRLGVRGDRVAHDLLMEGLARQRPHDAVLSEEATDDPARLSADRVWIVDPLDGTREYAEGRFDWAVHVALWAHGELVAGAVALPAVGLTARSDVRVPRQHPPTARPRIVVSRTRPPAIADKAAAAIGAEVVAMGSAGYKVLAVVRGDVDAYVHAGGQHEWDSAAPVAVARGSGLWTSRLSGEPLRYNQRDPYLPDLLVCRADLAGSLLSACAVNSGPADGTLSAPGGDVVDPRLPAEPAGPAGGGGDLHHAGGGG
jgi:3'(2'), 5'-bisphosphate nucleotidase